MLPSRNDQQRRCQRGIRRRFIIFALLISASGFLIAVPAMATEGSGNGAEIFGGAPADRWIYGGEVYLWGAGIGGSTSAGDDVDISFSDLLQNLDMAFMGTFAASKDKWTLFADFIYLDVSDDMKSTANIVGHPILAEIDVELKGFITTFGGAYSVFESDKTRLNLLAGGRYLWLEADLKFDVESLIREKVSDSGHTWDGIVGLRGKTDLNEKWYLTYYADVGAGDSDLTWQALAAVNYRFDKVDAVVGYRYLAFDFDDSDVFDDLNLSGPFAGVKFSF